MACRIARTDLAALGPDTPASGHGRGGELRPLLIWGWCLQDSAALRWGEPSCAQEAGGPLRLALQAELQRYHEDSFGWAMVCCHRVRPEAEEVLQETYLKVLDGRARFHGRSSFKTWLFAVLRRTAAERRRAARLSGLIRRRWREAGPVAPPCDPEAEAHRSQACAQLIAALTTLPERQRQVLHLVFYQELSLREAADVLGVRLGTARVHYERGKQRLREQLRKESPSC
jgi:RNA polymerase sigma-70 factor, ECF subfamily